MARNKTAIGAAVAIGLGLLLFAGLAKADPGRKPELPKKGPGGSKKWGKPKPGGPSVSDDDEFDETGPGLFVSADCEEVVEGGRFWPDPYEVDRNPERDDGTKQYDPAVAQGRACTVNDVRGLVAETNSGCTGLDFIDAFIINGERDPATIAQQIAQQVAPLCWDAPVHTWPDAFYNWYNYLVDRLTVYVEQKAMWLEEEGF